jgi:hypothetical protein
LFWKQNIWQIFFGSGIQMGNTGWMLTVWHEYTHNCG